MQGTVKFFSSGKGYGFIIGEANKEYFIHYSNIKMDGYKTLTSGQKVSFDIGIVEGKSKEQAINVVLI